MPNRPSRFEETTHETAEKPVMLVFVTVLISLALVLRAPDFWTMLAAELGRVLHQLVVSTQIHTTLIFQYQKELLQNFASEILAKGELAVFKIEPRELPLGTRIKSMFMIAACDISVIIPALNEEKSIGRCLESLVHQPHSPPAEIVVVDGGSTDRTVEVAEAYTDKVLVEPKRPVGRARNAGARETEGEILAFIDADTMAGDEWLSEIDHSFRSHGEAVGVTGPTLPYEGTELDKLAYHVATGWAQRFSLRLGRPHVAGFNCAYRRDAFWNVGGFDEDRVLSEDVMLSLRMRHHGPIVFNPQMIAYTSLRRIKRYGYPYLTTYYAINAATMLLFNRTLGYPQVR